MTRIALILALLAVACRSVWQLGLHAGGTDDRPIFCLSRFALVAGAFWGIFALLAMPAHAQQQCGPRDKMIEMLAEKFGETQRTTGWVGGANETPITAVMETYANDTTGSWTIILAKPDGSACMLASGGGWIGDDEPPMPPGERA
jgi:hypothetical protein